MKKLLSLGPKEFLSGMATSSQMSNGIFSELSEINLFAKPSNYGMLTTTFDYDSRGSSIDSKVRFVVEYEDPSVSRRTPTFYAYGENGSLYNLGSSGTNITEIDDGNEAGRNGASGMTIYSGNIYLFSYDDISLYNFTTVDNTWGSTADKALSDWNSGDDSWHIPYVYNGIMYFGNGNYLGYYNGTTLDTEYFQLPAGYNAVDISEYNGLLAILCVDLKKTSSIVLLYDGYSVNANYIYNKDGLFLALENFKGELVLGGKEVVFFNGGNFDPIYVNTTAIDAPHLMQYKDGVLYWADGNNVMAYGSKIASVKDIVYAPYGIFGDLSTFYIGMNYALTFSQILSISATLRVYDYGDTNGTEGTATTINLDVGNAIISKIGLSFTGIDILDTDYFKARMNLYTDDYPDNYVSEESVSVDFVNAKNVDRPYVEATTTTKPTKYLKLTIRLKNVSISRIDIYGTQTDRTN